MTDADGGGEELEDAADGEEKLGDATGGGEKLERGGGDMQDVVAAAGDSSLFTTLLSWATTAGSSVQGQGMKL